MTAQDFLTYAMIALPVSLATVMAIDFTAGLIALARQPRHTPINAGMTIRECFSSQFDPEPEPMIEEAPATHLIAPQPEPISFEPELPEIEVLHIPQDITLEDLECRDTDADIEPEAEPDEEILPVDGDIEWANEEPTLTLEDIEALDWGTLRRLGAKCTSIKGKKKAEIIAAILEAGLTRNERLLEQIKENPPALPKKARRRRTA